MDEFEERFPELVSDQQTCDASLESPPEGILYSMYSLVKRLALGQTKALQVVQNVTDFERLHDKLGQPTLVAVVVNKLPSPRKQYEPIIKYGEVSSKRRPLAKRMLESVFIPHMNNLAIEFEKRIQNRYLNSNITLGTVTLRKLPDELAKDDLIAVYSVAYGNLYIHQAFFDVMERLSDTFTLEDLEKTFGSIQDALPGQFVAKEMIYTLLLQLPALVVANFGLSITCVACLAGFSMLTPLILNYLLYEIASITCSVLHLPLQACLGIELGALMISYVMLYPAAAIIFYACKKYVCGSSLRFVFQPLQWGASLGRLF